MISDEYAQASSNATLSYRFFAERVFLVLKPPQENIGKVRVYLDDKLVDETIAGVDVKDGITTVDTDRLYTLIDLKGKAEEHILRLEFLKYGVEAFAFTFG